MMKQLLEDSQLRPDLFQFMGPPDSLRLDAWLRDKQYAVPHDLRELWMDTGGGTIFETETILAPFGQCEMADDVESVNAFHVRRGMPSTYLVFHVGVGGLSVFDAERGYLSIDEQAYADHGRYSTLEEWYLRLVRAEYAARYGLCTGPATSVR